MKILLLDVDGVVLQKGEYFSVRFAREYNVDPESVVEFFRGPYLECQKGEADLKEVLKPYLEKWGWKTGVDDFLQYWFTSDVVLNPGITEVLSQFKEKGVRCYLASNNEVYRAEVIMKFLEETDLLAGAYFSSQLKVRKEDPAFFAHIVRDLQVTPKDVYFVDNDQKNVDSASSVGIHAYLYTPQVLADLLASI
jgi:putative hydrolase of the HAD superfamily